MGGPASDERSCRLSIIFLHLKNIPRTVYCRNIDYYLMYCLLGTLIFEILSLELSPDWGNRLIKFLTPMPLVKICEYTYAYPFGV